ncbi:MAG: bifunctional pyr operon transcriptional regulator/uracil phosphoribosyltransferase PyrR [Planctomycetes bacterium]|nr:bifunctional pyr operon transcriptional regulator/uracil phosphoribosyltransferase PyrR [Planctomycetota bacterium]
MKRVILDKSSISDYLKTIAERILDRNKTGSSLALVGIQRRGVPLADRLKEILSKKIKHDIPTGHLDITLYRDDLKTIGPAPLVKGTDINFDITDKNVILVDDVLYTGRTIRAALDELTDLGRAKSIQLAVLVDRGNRELPIQADYAGKTIKTTSSDIIHVKLKETDGKDEVVLSIDNGE